MKQQAKQTIVTLANSIELASNIIYSIMGEEVANTLEGNPINKNTLNEIISMRVQANFGKYSTK